MNWKNVHLKSLIVVVAVIILAAAVTQQYLSNKDTFFSSWNFSSLFSQSPKSDIKTPGPQGVVYQESVVTKVVEDTLPSVVTIGISKTTTDSRVEYNPFDPFSPFRVAPGPQRTIEQNIGSGFIVSDDGLIITNKHVVLDTEAKYTVLTNDQEQYEVQQIYRDPLNDLAIVKIDATNLKPLPLGDSTKIKLGQMAIAIGTPLGEFQNTVTVGVVSGLGRGITAGSPFEGFVEELDNVIQTDAAISPGNSGGPLLNSSGRAVGVNTAIADEGQNIGFAIPINTVKELIQSFKNQGSNFERPYIGVRYQMVDSRTAILNGVVEGAYVESVVENSPADLAGIQADDIITEIDGNKLSGEDEDSLAKTILQKKIGDRVQIKVWRNDEILTFNLTLEGFSG
ncbi:hypothetical protein A3A93_06255 [Candidatus Roizmanbacteria bacterium RIFCSPLOWO2_01_FULL_38_12]|uniref:PDZ domain-containing protein n=1 Tax=Candidatus Roizmanbacteria bacterium RIFCSPLOWO2_01_FULL_38_12 TaxID=1802061 RepID=A0A1F7ITY8_9BACT|nr:MAG: hypothetical protein A2861_02025 [Candidatus Roizmanbacteria bacterium RIFCSPHIGHO2_01_FULL_38_15]OGK34847.1 MAG: hypothetical protein A3F59_00570 [Candidatus Roizmanbacteria bacterium RIFCSPHIGHO2_12_FULL_38_13]OGK46832.1 MAG: hypothetical protein A3A93_06255 [Candidatus Roizmanbacteria bacterium RIFCSPLOWO2_01_FULL_38_12]